MNNRIPAEVFPPGEFLKEELEIRGWTQGDFAAILGRPIRLVNEVIAGKRAITPETATGLAEAFGTSAEVWLNLEAAWQLSKVQPENDVVSRRARLYTKAPIKEMVRRQWIEQSSNIDTLESSVLRFFGLEHIDEEPALIPHAARKPGPYQQEKPSQTAMVYRARQLASSLQVATFDSESLRAALSKLKALMHTPEESRHVARILAESGIRLVIIEPLAGSKMDGITFWLDSQSPVITLSLRYDRMDYFWFTLAHELGHVSRKDGMMGQQPIMDIDIVGNQVADDKEKPETERLADAFASDYLIPSYRLQNFIDRTGPLYFKGKIVGFAMSMGVHPSIIVGRLQRLGEIGYSANREMLVQVRQFVVGSALTDGWGHIVSIKA